MIDFEVKDKDKDKDIEGIVLSPQFDISKFKVGRAIHVKSNSNGRGVFYGFSDYCLITDVTPLSIGAVCIKTQKNNKYDDDEEITHKVVNIVIPIKLVASGELTIRFLE